MAYTALKPTRYDIQAPTPFRSWCRSCVFGPPFLISRASHPFSLVPKLLPSPSQVERWNSSSDPASASPNARLADTVTWGGLAIDQDLRICACIRLGESRARRLHSLVLQTAPDLYHPIVSSLCIKWMRLFVARLRYTYIFELPRELYNSNIFSSFHSKSARIRLKKQTRKYLPLKR